MAKKKYKTVGALIKCSGGTIPVPIILTMNHGVATAAGTKFLLNANDHIPMLNIPVFGVCKFKPPTPPGANVCVPVLVQPWKKGALHCMIGGAPALTDDSFLTCMMGGTIKFQ